MSAPGRDGRTAAQRHMAAIEAGAVTKTNVIGIRKAINHVERLRHGWSGNRSNVTPEEADAIEAALRRYPPRVMGELHETGLKLLRSPRWRKRWNERQAEIIKRLHHFRLLRFDRFGRNGEYAVPVYLAVSAAGNFAFRNIPWQAAVYQGEESGPVAVGENS